MIEDPSDDDYGVPPRSNAGRYRAALRRAILRREQGAGQHVLQRWSWLLPWAVFASLRAGIAALAPVAGAGAHPPAIASSRCPTPAPQQDQPPWYPYDDPTFVVIVSKVQILVGDDPHPVVMLPPRDEIVRTGVGAKYKGGDAEGMRVVPLADAIERERTERRCAGKKRPLEAIVVMDGSLPYRLLVEVLYTLTQSDVGEYHLMVRSGKNR